MTEKCEAFRTLAGHRFECVRKPHGWTSPKGEAVAEYRRREGIVPEPDRHWFRRADA